MKADFARITWIAAAGSLCAAAAPDAAAVRVNPDGHGQALIYPYFTARSPTTGDPYATLITVVNGTSRHKALKVRFLEAKRGAEVMDFNLFLAPEDMWVAGVVPGGPGAGVFTPDNSCTSPKVSALPLQPSLFRNGPYLGDQLGDSLDRTYEGYFEVLEMGVIDPGSALAAAITSVPDLSAPNASKPSCTDLPVASEFAGLLPPSGGLSGTASLINVIDGADFTYDAIALSQWSDKAQWGAPFTAHPNLADASPPVSYVASETEAGDVAWSTRWSSGRDAVSAVLIAARTQNDFTFESQIAATTEWVLSMPTKRFHVGPQVIDAPFVGLGNLSADPARRYCEPIGDYYEGAEYCDREAQCNFSRAVSVQPQAALPVCGAVSVPRFRPIGFGPNSVPRIFNAATYLGINPDFAINGWSTLQTASIRLTDPFGDREALVAPAGATTRIDLASGNAVSGLTVRYVGLPVVGFAAQLYSNFFLQVGSSTVLSNYGATFRHKVRRKVDVQP